MRVVSDLVAKIESRQENREANSAALLAHAGSPAPKETHLVHQRVVPHDVVASTASKLTAKAGLIQTLPTPRLLQSAATMSGLWADRSQVQNICTGLYITNYFAASRLPLLQKEGITHVVVCANELPIAFPTHFSYLHLDGLTDNPTTSLQPHLVRSLPWIKDAVLTNGRVLLHCAAGCSRSGAIAIAYIMWSQGLSRDAAQILAQQARPIIAPNDGFMAQLSSFEASGCALRTTTDEAK